MQGSQPLLGGKSMRGGHIDGAGDDAKISADTEICYISNCCSILVIDRENQAMLEISLQFDD
jgi:hypothetical protein